MDYTEGCLKQSAMPCNKPEHLLVAEKIATDILSQEAHISIEMIIEITNIIKNTINERKDHMVEREKYLQNCLDSLKKT